MQSDEERVEQLTDTRDQTHLLLLHLIEVLDERVHALEVSTPKVVDKMVSAQAQRSLTEEFREVLAKARALMVEPADASGHSREVLARGQSGSSASSWMQAPRNDLAALDTLLKPGTPVSHPILGIGEVIVCTRPAAEMGWQYGARVNFGSGSPTWVLLASLTVIDGKHGGQHG